MKIAVVGSGKLGLPLACQFAGKGARVTACDVNPEIVGAINRGFSPVDEPGVPELLAGAVRDGRLAATTDIAAAVARSDAAIVVVPALLTTDRKPDTSIVEAVSRQIAAGLKPGTMISYETTLPVGGTRRLIPVLESSGLRAGYEFDLVYSPERLKSRLILERIGQVPKVVGGFDSRAEERAVAFYREYLGAEVIRMGSLEAAEMAKLAGMIYRDVNIALANELARYAEAVGIDFHKVIDAANTDGEAALLRPGIGVGGHCTPVYPYFLLHDGRELGSPVTIAERGRCINDRQPLAMVDRLERAWRDVAGSRVIILGLGFRPEVKEHILSPAFDLHKELERRGAAVRLHDPLYTPEEIREHGFTPVGISDLCWADALILNTAHSCYASLDFDKLASGNLRAVVDGRSLWDPGRVRRAGLIYLGVGHPDG